MAISPSILEATKLAMLLDLTIFHWFVNRCNLTSCPAISGRDDSPSDGGVSIVGSTLEGVAKTQEKVVKIVDEGSGDVFIHEPNLDQAPN
ncbi:hypothetical protein N7478_004339 [Penicillium angulare]|uniref:uncharacterized protein n=1 Tax=Penicillium angulare TaxID=116970 RepID=UPI0025422844|nr:uncharacterized protein N7478_004339 [Penicillium angulare]KAJ5278967.1 hypothetical protein N7478_004339 [Penicillium angulare]